MDGIIDRASFADIGQGGGRADQMNATDCRWQPSEKGIDSRIAGKSHVHSRLALRADGEAGLLTFYEIPPLPRGDAPLRQPSLSLGR